MVMVVVGDGVELVVVGIVDGMGVWVVSVGESIVAACGNRLTQ